MFGKFTPTQAKIQYETFKKIACVKNAKIEKFVTNKVLDCYNPSIPFVLDGREYILCRTQPRTGQYSTVYFFEKVDDEWHIVPDAPVFEMEDPSVAVIDGKVLISGVKIFQTENEIDWKTVFYICTNINDVQYLTCGPKHMKDIRLVQLSNKKICVFSRPLGKEINDGHLTRIGFTTINSLAELNAEVIEKAPPLNDFFLCDEWGGSNSAYELKNGLIGVIGHKSYHSFDPDGDHLHYYGTAFAVNPLNRETTDMKIIISRDCFPYADPREDRLYDVTFTAGVVRHQDGTATIYTGLGDSVVGSATIEDPFLEYETIKFN